MSNISPDWRRILQKLMSLSATERILLSFAALALSILVGIVIVILAGLATTTDNPWIVLSLGGRQLTFSYDPVAVFAELFFGALGSPFQSGWELFNGNLASTLRETTILTFTGLSVAIAFRAGLFNIGTQGQFLLGTLVTTLTILAIAPFLPGGFIGTIILIPIGVSAGAITGGLWGALPGALKAYADANEVITTIMLNSVAAGVAAFLVKSYFKPESRFGTGIQTESVPPEAMIPNLPFNLGFSPRDNFSLIAIVIAVAFAVAIYYLFNRLSFGYDLRTSGLQPEAATFSGVNAKRMTVASMTLSGVLGGVGGAMFVLISQGNFIENPGAFGFDGITVAILAGNNPLGVGVAALLFGILKSGASAVQEATPVPKQLIALLRGLIILFVAMPEFFRMAGARFLDIGPEDSPQTASDDDADIDLDTSQDGETDG